MKREQHELLQREIQGATRERMLREIGDALETITLVSPLMLVFEDLQWVNYSTVDLISALARRRTQAKLMLIATERASSAQTALGNYDRAFELLLRARDDIDRQPVVFDWYLYLLLESGPTELWLAKGDLRQARTEAQRFLQVTLATAERTWQPLALGGECPNRNGTTRP